MILFFFSLAVFATVGSAPASAADVHKFEPTPTAEISKSAETCGAVTGPLGQVNALTLSPGEMIGEASHLWVAEQVKPEEPGKPGSQVERVDQLGAATGSCQQQLQHPASLDRLYGGIAAGHGTGEREVYLGANESAAGEAGARVAVFGPAGTLQAIWTGEHTPNASPGHPDGFAESAGESEGKRRYANVTDVTVDESLETAADWARGDVLVSTHGGDSEHGEAGVVNVFDPREAAAGKEPPNLAAQLTGTCEAVGEIATGSEACHESATVPFTGPQSIAVDPADGDLLVADAHAVNVFEPVATGPPGEYRFLHQITETTAGHPFEHPIHALAAGGGEGDGDIYVSEDGAAVVYQFSSEGVFLGSLRGTPAGPFLSVESVAVNADTASPTFGDLFVGDARAAREEPGVVDVFGPDLVVPNVSTEAASQETPRSATLNGKLSALEAETHEAATCAFAWGQTEALEETPVPCAQNPVKGEEAAVSAKLGEGRPLSPDTTYYYQLRASNGNGTNTNGAILHFTTSGPGIVEASAAKVASTSATLQATLNPHGVATSYRFEYDTTPYSEGEGTHGTAVPVPAEPIGSAEGEKVEQHIQGLSPGTRYYYRVVTVGEPTEGVFETFDGEGHAFTTQGAGEFTLPDHRAYEMVSPPDKHGALIAGIAEAGGEGDAIQAAAGGNAITYVADTPTESEPAGYTNETQVFSARGPGGWSTHDLTVPHAGATAGSVSNGNEYRAFSEDLSTALVQPFGAFDPAISPEASEQTAFLHSDYLAGDVGEPCTSSCYRPLVTSAPGYANVPSGTPFGQFGTHGAEAQEEGELCPPTVICGPASYAATPDASHVVLASSVALTGAAIPAHSTQLYEWDGAQPAGRQLALVSLLPGEAGPPAGDAWLGAEERSMSGARSRPTARACSSPRRVPLHARPHRRRDAASGSARTWLRHLHRSAERPLSARQRRRHARVLHRLAAVDRRRGRRRREPRPLRMRDLESSGSVHAVN